MPVTMPIVFSALGFVLGAAGVVDVLADLETVGLLAEVTLAVILFSDAVRIELRTFRSNLGWPARLLGIGLPLTVVVGTVVNTAIFPSVGVATMALLAAVLAPTDAALGTAVVEDRSVPRRERLALNVESGLNDGLAVPAVTILAAIVLDERRGAASWIGFALEQIGLGVVVGGVSGGAAILALRWSRGRRWSDGRYEQLATLAVPILALTVAEVVEGNSFIAAFVAGLVFGSLGSAEGARSDGVAQHLAELTDDVAQLLGVIAFFVFGNVLLDEVRDDIFGPDGWRILLAALAGLTVVRIVPVWIALIGTEARWPTRLFLGWFGPRGLASIVFGLLLLERFETEPVDGEAMFRVIGVTVALSIVLHGATAAWGAARYGAWAQRADLAERERAAMDMHELAEHAVPRARGAMPRSPVGQTEG
jgi:NhaP-type Na+/H+ or K+/H+ antiporter